MAVFEVLLTILACVILSALLNRFIPYIALPLIQIAVGLLAAIIVPDITDIHVDSELFLVLFIAPLLFNEARNSDKRALWKNKWSILSLAIGLVAISVLIIGFTLNTIVPSIPLAAAFALAAALAPTDAAAVTAMSKSILLKPRQESWLSGESLINDASGVVSFQFAIAAVVTGAFSLTGLVETFSLLFFGGIVFGALIGLSAKFGVRWMHLHGFEDTRVHVVYQVFTPFVVFFASEAIGVSGILAVVACGIVMSDSSKRHLTSVDARNAIVSNSVWKVIVFLINGVIFVMLGMQLPFAFNPTLRGDASAAELIGLVLMIFILMVVIRFVWTFIMETLIKDPDPRPLKERVHSALILTFAGAKGSVTLSIIFTIPLTLSTGQLFPQRDLLIFLAAGVILCTLVLANISLPILGRSDTRVRANENDHRKATIKVLEGTIDELVNAIKTTSDLDIIPALRLTIAEYRTRLGRERFSEDECGSSLENLELEVLHVQQERADVIQSERLKGLSALEIAYYFQTLRRIRESVGYYGPGIRVGSVPKSIKDRIALLIQRFRLWLMTNPIDSKEAARIYYETCKFEVELERASIDYLESLQEDGDEAIVRSARTLIKEHESAVESIWGRLCYFNRKPVKIDIVLPSETAGATLPASADELPNALQEGRLCDRILNDLFFEYEEASFFEQFEKAEHYASMADAWALTIELEQIQRLYSESEIDEDTAKILRTDVYNMQMLLN